MQGADVIYERLKDVVNQFRDEERVKYLAEIPPEDPKTVPIPKDFDSTAEYTDIVLKEAAEYSNGRDIILGRAILRALAIEIAEIKSVQLGMADNQMTRHG